MCGIVGVGSTRPISNKTWLAKGREAIRHRGPDAGGEVWLENDTVGFGHQRLSIIDLSNAASQPMFAKQKQTALIFNGEIYNFLELKSELTAKGHSFNTNSDTEVILAAYLEWGLKAINRLNGMFAFAFLTLLEKKY